MARPVDPDVQKRRELIRTWIADHKNEKRPQRVAAGTGLEYFDVVNDLAWLKKHPQPVEHPEAGHEEAGQRGGTELVGAAAREDADSGCDHRARNPATGHRDTARLAGELSGVGVNQVRADLIWLDRQGLLPGPPPWFPQCGVPAVPWQARDWTVWRRPADWDRIGWPG